MIPSSANAWSAQYEASPVPARGRSYPLHVFAIAHNPSQFYRRVDAVVFRQTKSTDVI